MKKIVSGLLASTALLGFGVNAYAVDGVTTNDANKNVDSDATITVTAGTTKTDPEDKNDPDGTTGQVGPLSIDNVIRFQFADMQLSGVTQKISLTSVANQNVQVTDSRGTGAGWQLKIAQSELVNTTDATKTLKGAYIELTNAKIVSGKSNADKTALPTATTYAQTNANKTEFAPIMTAEKTKGMGTWLEYFNYNETNADDTTAFSEGIKLVVPSGNYVGTYAGTVTWQLGDLPTV